MASPARYHHGDLRAALIARATDVMAEGGVDALSLRELARDLGVSHGAPSRHFPDKRALLDALVVNGFERLRVELVAALGSSKGASDGSSVGSGAAGSFADQLTALAASYVTFAVANPSLLAVMFAAKHRRESPAEVGAAAERAFAAPLRAIAEAQDRGEVVAGPVDPIATAILATMHGFAALVAAGLLDPDDSGAALSATIHRLVDGLRPR